MVSQTKPNPVLRTMAFLVQYLSQDAGGGPRPLKLAWVINFQKFGTFFFVAGLMVYYQHRSTAAWAYLALHGSYGFVWLIKHFANPDPRWEARVTFGGAIMSFLLVLGPYWVFPFLLISDVLGPAYQRADQALICFCIVLHTLGVAIMTSADVQKYYSLKYRKGLITEGMFRYIRHPNYLGEMMIYGAYAFLVQHWIPWLILAWVWGSVFLPNMLMKEHSMSRYEQWAAYKKRSGFLLPWPWLWGRQH